jgi:hypothetical protein
VGSLVASTDNSIRLSSVQERRTSTAWSRKTDDANVALQAGSGDRVLERRHSVIMYLASETYFTPWLQAGSGDRVPSDSPVTLISHDCISMLFKRSNVENPGSLESTRRRKAFEVTSRASLDAIALTLSTEPTPLVFNPLVHVNQTLWNTAWVLRFLTLLHQTSFKGDRLPL